MMFGSWAASSLFFVVVTVVLVVVVPVVVFDAPVGALVPAALGVSTGLEVTDVVDDAETVVSAVDCLDGAQPPTMSAAAIKDDFTMVVIGFSVSLSHCSRKGLTADCA
jgi:hypothetical protein